MLLLFNILFCDAELSVCSNFVVEVAEVSRITAIFPNQITKKCIYIKMGDEIYYVSFTGLTTYNNGVIRDLSPTRSYFQKTSTLQNKFCIIVCMVFLPVCKEVPVQKGHLR